MRGRARPQILRSALIFLFFIFVSIFSAGDTISAQSTNVTAHIPVGIVAVEGRTSPGAQIRIYENGNDQPAASLTADSMGNFSVELPQDSAGMVTIGVQATDTNNKMSELVVRQVAVLAQQTSTLTVILPPTIGASPASVVFKQGTLNFSGQTLPNAAVEVTIEPSTVLTTASDSEGKYAVPLLVASLPSAGIYTYGVKVTDGLEVSDYVIAGTFVVTPPVQPPFTAPVPPLGGVVDKIFTQPVSAPEITFPSGDEYVSAEPFVITGRAEAGALVTFYDDGSEIGTVIAGGDGSWKFYFSPYKDRHTISAKACRGDRCSDSSRTITVRPGKSPACRPGVTLEKYRLSTAIGEPVELSGLLPEASAGTIRIAWGDGTTERFDTDPSRQLEASHSYQEAGTYSGHVVLGGGTICYGAAYFAVEVLDPAQSIPAIVLIGIVGILLVIIARLILTRRFSPSN